MRRNGVEERYDPYAKMGERGFQTGEPGVAEAAPGLLQVRISTSMALTRAQTSNIAPLAPEGSGSTGDVASSTAGSETASSALDSIAGAAKQAYEAVTGNPAS